MKHLPDVNLLVALLDAEHAHHDRAEAWFVGLAADARILTSPITELGLVRVLMQRTKPAPITLATAQAALATLRASARVAFVADDVGASSLPAYVQKAKDTTDGHLLALARRHGADFVTFDTGIPGAKFVR